MTKDEMLRRLDDILSAVPVHAHRFHAGRGDKWDDSVDTLNGIDDVFDYIRPALVVLLESASAGGGIPGPTEATQEDADAFLDYRISTDDHLIINGLNAVFAARLKRRG